MTACHAQVEHTAHSPSSFPPMQKRHESQTTLQQRTPWPYTVSLSCFIFLLTFFTFFFWEAVSRWRESWIIDKRLLRKTCEQGDVLKRAEHKRKLGHGRAVQRPFYWLIDGSVSLHLFACCLERRWDHVASWKEKQLSPSTYPSRGQGATHMSVVFWCSHSA